MVAAEDSVVLVPGPWTHRDIATGSARFHAVEAGAGPLVLLLHGFPQFWWAWRHQLVALAEAGYRAVAVDLRGYGASDKPPRGYDALTLAGDVAGMVRALGERSAVVVGHDWGGYVAWTTAARHPDLVRGLGIVGSAHPLALRRAVLTDPRGQGAASRHVLGFQTPRLAERWLTADGAAAVERLLRQWSAGGFPDAEAARRYRAAMLVTGAAHSALEYHRWAVRSQLRPDERRFARLVSRPVSAPTLQVHGDRDRCVLPATARESARFVVGEYEMRELTGVGHFPAEEAPAELTRALLRWLAGLVRDRDGAGRARNARPRDPTGRPLPRDAAGEPARPDEPARPPEQALAEAERLLSAARPFAAHEVLEAAWKAAPSAERELWRGLAQVAVGLTHAQRGNSDGAATLLRRGSARIAPYARAAPYGIEVDRIVARAESLAGRIETAGPEAIAPDDLRVPLSRVEPAP